MMSKKILALILGMILFSPQGLLAKTVFSFEGEVDFQNQQMDVALDFKDESFIKTKIQKTGEEQYHLSLKADHVQTPFFDLSSDIEGLIEVPRQRGPLGQAVSGKLWSSYSLIDYKPIRELSGRFEIKDEKLFLDALSFGSITCSGYIDLVSPHQLDLAINLTSIDMDDFLNFWVQDKEYLSSGEVVGEIKASGSLEQLYLKGILQSHEGFIKNLEYDSIYLNLEGYYPHMQISHSTLSKSDGVSFSFDGPFDLSDQQNFKKQIKALTLSPLVSDTDKKAEWTIKRLKPEGSATTEVKYLLRKEKVVGTASEEDSGMLGIERTVEF